ncbi:ABC transporter ATP-binding protein [Streptosporangiaceae bacterium NEAU-GS5]|nr:ABC transporter ATP-binding protein [Streptosporangiaceae bacterium NEAU-GS5]
MVAIDVAGVSKRYGHVLAVDDVSLQVAAGEIYALLGLNGAGKTTLIRMLLGMAHPTAGLVRVLGSVIRIGERSAWAKVGYLVEGAVAYPELTVRENLEVMRRLRGIGAATVDTIIDRLALGAYADRRARHLSMGNLQRLGLAKALLHRPGLLILDEPVNGLDPAGVVEIRTLLADLAREEGTTVFLSSHLLAEVARVASRIGIIHGGRLIQELSPRDLDGHGRRLVTSARDLEGASAALRANGFAPKREPDGALVLTDDRAVERPDDVATLLVAAGCPPTRLVVEQAGHEDLESHFLRVIGSEMGEPSDG